MQRRTMLGGLAAGGLASFVRSYAWAARSGSQSTVPRGLLRREDTVLRLGGQGDNFHMTWTADERQLVSVCDGLGWADPARAYYNSLLVHLTGDPHAAAFETAPTYPALLRRDYEPSYYPFGIVAVGPKVYQFLTTLKPFRAPDGTFQENNPWNGVKLIYSPDNGRSWCNQDGSSPVVWESGERTRRSMLFLDEEQNAFSLISVLQMGRGYSENRDGYIYLYSPNGNLVGQTNQLVLARTPLSGILERARYEFFVGRTSDGMSIWSKDIARRGVVHTFPKGWFAGFSWMPSVTYNPTLGLYMMVNWGTGVSKKGEGFGRPSYMGFWIAPRPWGPWTQIHEESAWTPGGGNEVRAYSPQIAPKWISPDGRSFWMVWSDYQVTDASAMERSTAERIATSNPTNADEVRWAIERLRYRKFYAFNAQRIDLVF